MKKYMVWYSGGFIVVIFLAIFIPELWRVQQQIEAEIKSIHKVTGAALRQTVKPALISKISYASRPVYYEKNACVQTGELVLSGAADTPPAKFAVFLNGKGREWRVEVVKVNAEYLFPGRN